MFVLLMHGVIIASHTTRLHNIIYLNTLSNLLLTYKTHDEKILSTASTDEQHARLLQK